MIVGIVKQIILKVIQSDMEIANLNIFGGLSIITMSEPKKVVYAEIKCRKPLSKELIEANNNFREYLHNHFS